MTQPGWYGEPGNPTLERFWDGSQWTPQTRSVVPAPTSLGETSLDLGEAVASDAQQRLAESSAMLARLQSSDPAIKQAALTEWAAAHPESSTAQRWQQTQAQPVVTVGQPTGSAALVCPHCQTRGRVTSRKIKQKKGVSGGKATGAVLTAGISLLATGLSRKESVTEMRCGNCRTVWHV